MKLLFGNFAVVIFLLSIQLVNAEMLGNRYSDVPTLTTAQVQALQIDQENIGQFVLVDVRSKAETDVSIIPGAITKEEFERTKQRHQGEIVIAYCTVGHRSGNYARKLKQSGWDAWNYKGSILDWCKNQLPVVTQSGQSTQKVHTYNANYQLAEGYQAVY